MVEPEKPFACTLPDCGMTFTNEDHLNVHTKKHDMVLQLGLEQKAAFVADQTPTPTRFIRNCEEVGLFQDLQNVTVNPFDEGFKRAMETKQGILSLENAIATSTSSDDVLHTPQLVLPLDDPTLLLLQSHRSGISRSSSDDSTIIKGYETTISKLTSEVTINRVDHEITVKQTDISKSNENTKTSICSIQTNDSVEVIKEKDIPIIVCNNVKTSTVTKDVVFNDNSKFLAPEKVPLISQKSLDFVVDSLTNEAKSIDENVALKRNISNIPNETKIGINKLIKVVTKTGGKKHRPRILPRKVEIDEKDNKSVVGEYEVLIKLPNGKQVRMKPVEEQNEPNPKEIIRNNILKKPIFKNKLQTTKTVIKKVPANTKLVTNVLKIPTGTLIPVTLVNQAGAPLSNDDLSKVPITKIDDVTTLSKITVPALTKLTNKVLKAVPPVSLTKTTVTTKTPPVFTKGTLIPIINTPKISNIRSLATTTSSDTIQKDTPTLASITKINPNINDNLKLIPVTDKNTPVPQASPTVTTPVTGNDTTNHTIGNEVYVTREDLNRVILTKSGGVSTDAHGTAESGSVEESDDDCIIEEITNNPEIAKRTKFELESRSAASKRYRERLKLAMQAQAEENKRLRDANEKLAAEKALLKLLIIEHLKRCPDAEDFRLLTQDKLQVLDDT